jgi:hypothetical protein
MPVYPGAIQTLSLPRPDSSERSFVRVRKRPDESGAPSGPGRHECLRHGAK